MKFRTSSALRLRVGYMRGLITHLGFIMTMSIPFSFENFQAASLAYVFESTYHSYQKLNNIQLEMVSECSATTNQYKNLTMDFPTHLKACAHKAHV